MLTWIIFRADSLTHAISYYSGLCDLSLFEIPQFPGKLKALQTLLFILCLICLEWKEKTNEFPLINLGRHWNKYFRYSFYYVMILIILYFSGTAQDFIYFQF
jgi:hypothetical protein